MQQRVMLANYHEGQLQGVWSASYPPKTILEDSAFIKVSPNANLFKIKDWTEITEAQIDPPLTASEWFEFRYCDKDGTIYTYYKRWVLGCHDLGQFLRVGLDESKATPGAKKEFLRWNAHQFVKVMKSADAARAFVATATNAEIKRRCPMFEDVGAYSGPHQLVYTITRFPLKDGRVIVRHHSESWSVPNGGGILWRSVYFLDTPAPPSV